jgi:hypothetical protein
MRRVRRVDEVPRSHRLAFLMGLHARAGRESSMRSAFVENAIFDRNVLALILK